MWIRSQDKEKLADLRVFDITSSEDAKNFGIPYGKFAICGYSDDWANTNNFHIKLGLYSTKEKALKVLDKIVDRIRDIHCGNCRRDIVFQMPQDDEVCEYLYA